MNTKLGIFSGKLIKVNRERTDVQHGPNLSKPPKDPVLSLLDKTMGKIPYEPTGYINFKNEPKLLFS